MAKKTDLKVVDAEAGGEPTPVREASAALPAPVATAEIGGRSYRLARRVTRAILGQKDGVAFYVEFETSAREAPPLDNSGKAAIKTPPRVADVIDLSTGEACLLILNAVLEAELDRAYPDGSYVGHKFAVMRFPHPNADKRYKIYSITEIEAV